MLEIFLPTVWSTLNVACALTIYGNWLAVLILDMATILTFHYFSKCLLPTLFIDLYRFLPWYSSSACLATAASILRLCLRSFFLFSSNLVLSSARCTSNLARFSWETKNPGRNWTTFHHVFWLLLHVHTAITGWVTWPDLRSITTTSWVTWPDLRNITITSSVTWPDLKIQLSLVGSRDPIWGI